MAIGVVVEMLHFEDVGALWDCTCWAWGDVATSSSLCKVIYDAIDGIHHRDRKAYYITSVIPKLELE